MCVTCYVHVFWLQNLTIIFLHDNDNRRKKQELEHLIVQLRVHPLPTAASARAQTACSVPGDWLPPCSPGHACSPTSWCPKPVDLPGLKSGRSPFVTENGLSTPNTWRFLS